MKTQLLRVSIKALAVTALVFCGAGCQEDKVQAAAPLALPANNYAAGAELETPTPGPVQEAVPTSVNTNAPAETPAVKIVQAPAPPADIKASPALAEVIKLVEAGVSEDIILTYIHNSPQPFNVNSDQIVYLNDLGVSTAVLNTLMQHDTSPAIAAAKNAPTNPLPPSVDATAPANVAPPPQAEPPPAVAAEAPVTTSYFYSSLAPYGSWIDVNGYGLCWQPTVAVVSPTWRPYCERGHWIWTDCGWYWYSDYSWGWAPFHYGRWCSYPRPGWFWVPDTCWGPSWVSWRYSSSHCGWAPLPPAAHFVSGVGFTFGGGAVGIGFEFGLAPSLYTFVPLSHLHDRSFYSHRLSSHQVTTVYHNTTVVNNYIVNNGTVINHGIDVNRVSRASGQKITAVAIQPATHTTTTAAVGRPGRREQLQNNGTALRVVRPDLAANVKPTRISSTTQTTLPSASQDSPSGRRFTPEKKTEPAPVRLAPTTAQPATSTPIKAQEEQPRKVLSSQQPSGRLPNKAVAETVTAKPQPVIPTTTPSVPTVSAKPQPRTTLFPPTGEPAGSQGVRAQSVPNTVVPPIAPRASSAPSIFAPPAAPRTEPVVPQFGRPSFAPPRVPVPSRPAALPPGYPEGGRSYGVRSQAGNAPATPPAVRSAPVRGASEAAPRSGGNNQKDQR